MAQPVCVLKEHEGQVGESGDPLAWACVTRKPSHHGRTDRSRNTSDVFPIEGEEGGGLRRASRSDGLCRLQTQTDKLKHDSGPCIESCRASGYSPPPRRTRSKGVSLFSARWSRSIKCPRRAGFCLLLMADFYRQPASAYRFWQRLVLPSRSLSTWPGLEETFPARISKRSPNPLSHASAPLAGSARPSAGRSARKLPSPGHPCSDIPCRRGTQRRPAAHDWLGVWSSQSAHRAPHHNLLRTDGPYQDNNPCSTAQETLRAARDFLNPILPITDDGGGRLRGSSENDRSPLAQRSLRLSSRNLG